MFPLLALSSFSNVKNAPRNSPGRNLLGTVVSVVR
jgi:hypothetical protein